jgi:hypothetical protein
MNGSLCGAIRRDQGSVLLSALMVILLIATVGAALGLVASTELTAAANYEASQQGLYAADAGVERTIGELRLMSTWAGIPASSTGTSFAEFNDGQLLPPAPDRSPLNLPQLTSRRQADSDAMYPSTPNRPVWHLFAHAPLNRIVPGVSAAAPYVVVWVADDADDVDGDPSSDSNDVVVIHAEAFGVRGGKRAIEVTLYREEAMAAGLPGVMRSDVQVLAWHEVR